jgi:hypothetical protein
VLWQALNAPSDAMVTLAPAAAFINAVRGYPEPARSSARDYRNSPDTLRFLFASDPIVLRVAGFYSPLRLDFSHKRFMTGEGYPSRYTY